MLGIKKLAVTGLIGFVVASGFLGSGCTPPGPNALLKGQRLIGQGKYDSAIEQLQLATRLLPNHPQAWNHLGMAYHGARRPSEAVNAYNQALKLDHKLAVVRYNLGCLFLEQNELAFAIEQLTSFVMVESKSVNGRLKLGEAYLRARQLDPREAEHTTASKMGGPP